MIKATPGPVRSIEQLEAIYGVDLAPASVVKVTDHITPDYRVLIQASPFVMLATCGPEGVDCSPRGDAPGFVRVDGPRTLMLPDRRGNNRIDSLRNVVRDPRIALLFLIPGSGTTFRVNGRAVISADPDLLSTFAVESAPPRTVLIISSRKPTSSAPALSFGRTSGSPGPTPTPHLSRSREPCSLRSLKVKSAAPATIGNGQQERRHPCGEGARKGLRWVESSRKDPA